jgi:hypothetical protein
MLLWLRAIFLGLLFDVSQQTDILQRPEGQALRGFLTGPEREALSGFIAGAAQS